MSFSTHTVSKLDQLRELHASFLSKETETTDYLKRLQKINIKRPEIALAVLSALSSSVLFNDISGNIAHFARCFSFLISHDDEVVRRSCLMIISIISQKGLLDTLITEFIRLFASWNDRAQEMILSFAFSFNSPSLESFKALLPLAESVKNSSDELLSSTAADFIIYLNAPQAEPSNEPRAVMLLRSSVDLSKIHDHEFSNEFDEPINVDRGENNYNNNNNNGNKNYDKNDENAKRAATAKSNDDMYHAEPPVGKALIRNSVNLKKSAPVSRPTSKITEFEEEEETYQDNKSRRKSEEIDNTFSAPPPGKCLLRNSSNDIKTAQSYDDPFEEEEPEEPAKSGPGRKIVRIPKPKTQPNVDRKTALKKRPKLSDFDDYNSETAQTEVKSEILNEKQPKSANPRSAKQGKSTRNSIPAGGAAANASTENTPETKKSKAPAIPPVSEIVPDLRGKDWEKQQATIEILSSILLKDPQLLSPFCKDIWLNLLDAVCSPRTILSNIALHFSSSFYVAFSTQLCSQVQQYVVTLLNQCCSSHQFIADGSAEVLLTIADNSPRNRVFNPFMTGIKHKNSIARGKALQCLAVVVEGEVLEEKEIKAIVSAVAPLLRDTRVETRDAAKRVLKVLTVDDRFPQIAKVALNSAAEFKEMMRMIE